MGSAGRILSSWASFRRSWEHCIIWTQGGKAGAVLVIHERCGGPNIDNSNIIYLNKHRLIKKKWEFLISESGKGSKGRIPCSPTFAYVWYMHVYSCMQICLHMEWGLGLRLALVTLPYFKIVTPHWAWCLPIWLVWLAGQQVPGILPLALELQACVVMPDFLCGCWGYELSTSCLCSKPCSYWAISLAHM